MAVSAQLLTATLSRKGDKIVVRGSRSPHTKEPTPEEVELNDFLHSMPASRWFSNDFAWSIDATPGSAWRLLNHAPAPVQADEQVLALATDFAESLDVLHEGQQPELRKLDLWDHQVDAYHFANAKPGAMLALRMGEGKSAVTVNLIVNRRAMRTLILCPHSVLGVWRREMAKHAGAPVEVLILEKGTVAAKTRQADAFLTRCGLQKRPAVVVINYESAWRADFSSWSLKQKWDAAVLDESHRVKAHDTAVSKYANQLGRVAAFRLCLTGTPMPHSPLDLFGQFRFLDRGIFGTWFHQFRNRYAKLNPMFPGKVDQWLNQEELGERFRLLAYRVDHDVLNLPPAMHHERFCSLDKEGQRIYRQLEDEMIADVESGVVTAANALTRLLRLQQCTSGFAVLDESKKEVQVDDAKRAVLADLIEDVGPKEPIVIFCRFKHDLAQVAELAAKMNRRYGELSGRWKHGLDDHGCMAKGVEVMGVQIASGAVGVDLTRARYCAFYSQTWSLGEFDQAVARVHRPGQTKTSHFFHLIASGTIDERMRWALDNKREVIGAVLEGMKRCD